MKNFLSIAILFVILVSCDPCDDCSTTSFEPTVSFVFINQDSISHIDDSLAVFAFNDSVLTANIDSLDILRDSLHIVNDSITNGGSLISEKEDLEQWIQSRQADSLEFATRNKDADSLATIFNATKTTINSGLIQVDQVEILGTSFIETYEDIDSAVTWRIPLSFNQSFNQYQVTISNLTEIIELSYDTKQEINEERNVLIRAENIQVIDKMYVEIDSVKSNCENCTDGETVFTFYF